MTAIDLTTLTDLFLTWIVTYGASIFALALFLGALGIPVPGTLFVLAAGAFVRQGVLDMGGALLFGLVGVVIGDAISYGVGYFARGWLTRRFGSSATWQRAETSFQERGGIAVYLSRWLITPIAIPIDWIAGSSGYRFSRFLLYDAAGELTWLLLYGGLGYWFGSQWELISELASDMSGLLVGVVVLGLGVYLLRRKRPLSNEEAPTAEMGVSGD
ncbi:MAG: DedA family protein [Chloroflexota bacterium]